MHIYQHFLNPLTVKTVSGTKSWSNVFSVTLLFFFETPFSKFKTFVEQNMFSLFPFTFLFSEILVDFIVSTRYLCYYSRAVL